MTKEEGIAFPKGATNEQIDQLIQNVNNVSGEEMAESFKEEQDKQKKADYETDGFIWDNEKLIKNKVFPMDSYKDSFAFGLLLPKIVDDIIKGKTIGKAQRNVPCLITSKKELIEINLKNLNELKINFSTIPNYLPQRWDLDKIKDYLKDKTAKVDGKDLLNMISEQYKKYIAIRNDNWYSVLSLWDIGTYLYQLFEAYPFIEHRGIAGTAKTKAMTVSSFISFNGGQIMANPSEATLFRETDEVRGSKYFDEAEKLWIFNKSTKQYEGDVRTELINASYTKTAKVPRMEKEGNKFVTKWYSPYSPTQLASINGLYGATETRAITRITTKSTDADPRGEKEPMEDKNDLIWAEIRDKLYRFALDNWQAVSDIYLNFPKDCGLKRRELQIWKPLLSIANFIDKGTYQKVLSFAIELSDRRLDDLIQESSFDYQVLEALKLSVTDSKGDRIYVDLIKKRYCGLNGKPEQLSDIYLNRNISNHLDKLGFKELRARDMKGSYFAVTKGVFDEIVAPICPQLAFLSTSSPLSTLINENKGESKKSDEDSMKIDVDKRNENMTIMSINGENVDDKEVEGLAICSKCNKNQALILKDEVLLCEECIK